MGGIAGPAGAAFIAAAALARPALPPARPPLAAAAVASACSAVSPRPGITIIPSSARAAGAAIHSAAASANARRTCVRRPFLSPRAQPVIAVSSIR
ncbi:hypothetical protein [Burkholderia pseudomultivorans]|uniref:hypothetical protein n=1 Tax=Burkholderia pseudomultivorans TaxID=1207504 RepID=UPI00287BC414|nr:hypothetical protein [Burkholderia pseudomultivorans]